jgi:hypothetical protein
MIKWSCYFYDRKEWLIMGRHISTEEIWEGGMGMNHQQRNAFLGIVNKLYLHPTIKKNGVWQL